MRDYSAGESPLRPGLPPVLQWALEHWGRAQGVQRQLAQVIDACLLTEGEHGLGSVLEVLAQNETHAILGRWSIESDSADLLYALGQAVRRDPSVSKQLSPLSHAKPASSFYRGKIERFYLAALLVARLPIIEEDTRHWYVTLRAWVLVHAVSRSLNRCPLDTNLQLVATKLRLAHDGTTSWLEFFGLLRTNLINLQGLDLGLISRSDSLLHGKFRANNPDRSDTLPGDARSVLRAIRAIAQGKTDPVSHELPPSPAWIGPVPIQSDEANFVATSHWGGEGDDDAGIESILSAGDESVQDIRQIQVNEQETLPRQALSAKTVLIQSAEQRQLLKWSWHHLMDEERAALDSWVSHNLTSSTASNRHQAATLWIALATGRTLKQALEIRYQECTGNEWSLARDGSYLERLSPRPKSGWKPDHQSILYCQPAQGSQRISLPDEVIQALLAGLPPPGQDVALGDFYRQSWGDKPASTLTTLLPKELWRVKATMLAPVLSYRAYAETSDGLFARVLASHPGSALPGSAAYPAWGSTLVGRLLDPARACMEAEQETNALGSLLQPMLSNLQASVAKATERLAGLMAGNDLIALHNAYTGYHVMALLAATLVRPNSDPFECFQHFGLAEGIVFCSEKVSGPSRNGRLIPIPKALAQWVEHEYPIHLRHLVDHLQTKAPQLAQAIESLTQPRLTKALPLFFFLKTSVERGITWASITEDELQRLSLFDWPVPMNLFRHYGSSVLRRAGLDPEIIDALLGHAESWSATHGPYSLRVWRDDMAKARPLLEDMFSFFGFRPTPAPGCLPECTEALPPATGMECRPFGIEARRIERLKSHHQARREAGLLIRQALGGKSSLADLDKEALDLLSRRLVTTARGTPHPHAQIRMDCLVRRARRTWQQTGRKVLLKNRYVSESEEPSHFSELAPRAEGLIHQAGTILQERWSKKRKERISHSEAPLRAAVLLLTESRICDRQLLKAVMEGRGIRLVAKRANGILSQCDSISTPVWNPGRDQAFLEFSPSHAIQDDEDDESLDVDTPVRRYAISWLAARWLDMALSTQRHRPPGSDHLSPDLAPLGQLLSDAGLVTIPVGPEVLIQQLAALVDQANQLEAPGLIAAYLNGSVDSYALSWHDWLRVRWNERRQVEASPPQDEGINPINVPAHRATQREMETGQVHARRFLRIIRGLLTMDGVLLQHENLPVPTDRRSVRSGLNSLLADQCHQVSGTLLALGTWVRHLLDRQRGKYPKLRLSSIRRYLSALSRAFEGVGYDQDIQTLDAEGLTQLYEQVLEFGQTRHRRYVARRLVDFHRWARRYYGLEEPDWTSLDMGAVRATVDSGVIREAEYQQALKALINLKENPLARGAAFILFCCYRFGLREGEAAHLTREDWRENDDHLVLIIRSTHHHTLKVPTSRRVVPLVFKLTKFEHQFIHKVILAAESIHGAQTNELILATKPGEDIDVSGMTRLVLTVLKHVTGNAGTTLHQARHTAANRILLALLGQPLPQWKTLADGRDGKEVATILGATRHSRSHLWVVARYLGHTNLETGLRNYLHCLGDMAESAYRPLYAEGLEVPALRNLTDLGALPPQDVPAEQALGDGPTYAHPSPHLALQVMRLLARGKSMDQIVQGLALDPEWGAVLEVVIHSISVFLKLGVSRKSKGSAEVEFLRRINEATWENMLKATDNKDCVDSAHPGWKAAAVMVLKMVGNTGQILAYESQHYEFVSQLINYYEIKNEYYALVASEQRHDLVAEIQLNNLTATYNRVDKRYKAGVKPMSGAEDGLAVFEKPIRLDSVIASGIGSLPRARCALILKENKEFTARSKLDFLVLTLAYAAGK